MIDYVLRGIRADELTFKTNPINMQPDMKFDMSPRFSRTIQAVKDNPKINIVILECRIESSEQLPRPFDVIVRLRGVFEVNNMNDAEDRRVFALNATETLYPYVRAAVSNLTCCALLNPVMLPVISGATLFPEDRNTEAFETPKDVN